MNNHIIKNVADLFSNQDVASKNYVDKKNAISTAGGVVPGDIKLSVGSHLVRSLGCNDLCAGKKFTQFSIASAYQDKNLCRFCHPD